MLDAAAPSAITPLALRMLDPRLRGMTPSEGWADDTQPTIN